LRDRNATVRRRSVWAICAFAIIHGAPAGADTSLEVERACKPVVPQVIVTFVNPGELRAGYQLLVHYHEAGSAPLSDETFKRANGRFSGCDVEDARCISSRARYERRLEGLREQSIQLHKIGGWVTESESNILGAVDWYGPSYPDRVRIMCDLTNSDARTACVVESVEYTPNPSTSGSDGRSPDIGRHDQCQPDETRPLIV